MPPSLNKTKANSEKKGSSLNRQVRIMQKAWLAKKFSLPTSFDDCLAYFTGYKPTTLQIKSTQEFLSLASKCADYCNRLQDKESLQLLMYAIVRRVYEGYSPKYSSKSDLLGLLDSIHGDTQGIYQDNTNHQINDTVEIFKILLLHIESKPPKHINLECLHKEEIVPTSPVQTTSKSVSTWHERFRIDRHPEEAIPFTRGGGLYHFLDMKKGLTSGVKDDSRTLNAIYVTPENCANRDEFYAYDPSRCRIFLDKPSIQSGRIAAKHLKSTNSNGYEALIEVQNLGEINDLHVQVIEKSYLNRNYIVLLPSFFTKLKETYLVDSNKKALTERISMVEVITNASSTQRPQIRKELLTKDHLNPKMKYYINRLQLLCQNYQDHLNNYPNSNIKNIVCRLQSILTLDETQPLIRELKNFATEINANKQQLLSLEEANVPIARNTFSDFLHDILVLILRLISFKCLAANTPMLFFGSRDKAPIPKKAQSFTDETTQITEEAIEEFIATSAHIM